MLTRVNVCGSIATVPQFEGRVPCKLNNERTKSTRSRRNTTDEACIDRVESITGRCKDKKFLKL